MVSPSLDSMPPQHGHSVGDGNTTRSRGRCAGSGARTGLARRNARTAVVVSDHPRSAMAASSAAAVSASSSCISSWSSSLRPRSDEASKRSRFSLAIISLRCATIASAPAARASDSRRAARSASSAAFSALMSLGIASGESAMPHGIMPPKIVHADSAANQIILPILAARCAADVASRCLRAYNPVAPP